MEQLFISLTIILGAICVGQFFKIKKMYRTWSPNADWYLNEIPRRLKENLINRLEYYLDERNIQIEDFLEYIHRDDRELEGVVESILEKTSLVKLFLPTDQKVISVNGINHYAYRIGAYTTFANLLSGFEGSSKQYAYDLDNKYKLKDLENILEQDPSLKDFHRNTRIHFLVIKYGRLHYIDTYWRNSSDVPHWWPMGLIRIDRISDNGLQHSLRKNDHILILPKIIEK